MPFSPSLNTCHINIFYPLSASSSKIHFLAQTKSFIVAASPYNTCPQSSPRCTFAPPPPSPLLFDTADAKLAPVAFPPLSSSQLKPRSSQDHAHLPNLNLGHPRHHLARLPHQRTHPRTPFPPNRPHPAPHHPRPPNSLRILLNQAPPPQPARPLNPFPLHPRARSHP